MKRSMCGIALLAAATALWSCNGDPTGSIRDTGQEILADPTTLFVSQGESKFVTVELVDGQGNQLAAQFTPQNVGAGVTVVRDSTFLQTTVGTPIQTSERYIVTGVAPGSTSFDVVSGTTTKTIPVRVIPTSFAATFSNATPGVNEPVTVTLPAGYKFVAGAGVSSNLGAGIVTSVAVDSGSLIAVLPLGSTGSLTLDSVQADFIPGVTLGGLPTDATITVAATAAAGTGSTATAPSLPVPGIDSTTGFFDIGTFTAADVTADAGVAAQYYKLVITEAGDYTITTNWPATSTSDIDMIQCPSSGCAGSGVPPNGQFVGTGTSHPEQGTITLAPGTYFLAVVLFAGGPTDFGIQIDHAATPPPPAP
jgi:hypothetical protein